MRRVRESPARSSVRAKALGAVALAASAIAACGPDHYLGGDAAPPGSSSGSSAGVGSTLSASGSSVSNPVEGVSGSTVVTGGSTSGTAVSSGFAESGSVIAMGSGSVASGTVTGYPSIDAGTNAQAFCRVPAMNAGTLPFVVDTAFVPSGWMGDAPAYEAMPANPLLGTPASPASTARMTLQPVGYSGIGDACTPDGIGRSSPGAKGTCWKATFVPFPKSIQPGITRGSTKIGGGPGYGWAGAFWQYPRNNWGNLSGGFPIPPGANTVSFWARGKDGGEKVRFFTGEGIGVACSDYVSATSTDETMQNPPSWQHYTIDITGLAYSAANITPGQGLGGYYGGVIGAFGFGVGDQTLPSLGGASAPPNETDPDGGLVVDPAVPAMAFPPFFDSTITFYIDDIEFQIL
jgi:hypothetical protein